MSASIGSSASERPTGIAAFVRRYGIRLLLFAAIAFGATLRLSDFIDRIRLNDDQIRDAAIIHDMRIGVAFPDLGPKAGGTGFNLGPFFYHFEYAASLLFGDSPEGLALPVALFAILSIPLAHILFRRLFDDRTAILLTLLYAISFFLVKYSRFAWNPNLIPILSIATLLSFHRLLDRTSASHNDLAPGSVVWPTIAGLLVGIGVQLHTTLLLMLPLLLAATAAYALPRKQATLSRFLLVIAVALAVNTPQIVHEFRTGGENTTEFFLAFAGKTTTDEQSLPFSAKLAHAALCTVQADVSILSGIATSDDCDLASPKNRTSKTFLPALLLGSLFILGGFALWIRDIASAPDGARRDLSLLSLAYVFLFLFLLIPLGQEVSLRFFLSAAFLPFILLGYWLTFAFGLMRNRSGFRAILLLAVSASLILSVETNLALFRSVYVTRTADAKLFGGLRYGDIRPVAVSIRDDIASNGLAPHEPFLLDFEGAKAVEFLIRLRGDQTIRRVTWKDVRTGAVTPSETAYIVDDIGTGFEKKKSRRELPGYAETGSWKTDRYEIVRMTSIR